MSNYIYDNTALFFPKTNLAPLPGGADSTKYVQDTDWNTLNQAVDDIKGVLRGAAWYGLDDQLSDPAPSSIGAYLWLSSTGALNLKNGITNSTFLLSTRTISTGTGLTGGGDLSANRTISLASVPIGTTIGSATQGSVLFAGASSGLAQDNANFFWNDTTNRLGLGTISPGFALTIHDGSVNSNDVVEVRNKSATGYSTIWYTDSAGAHKASVGYANASAPITFLRGFFYYYTDTATTFTFADVTARAIDVYPTSGSVGMEFSTGGSLAVSSANKGRIRYNTTGQKFQISTNGGAYVDLTTGSGVAIGNTITSATAGSVLFAGTAGVLAQDNSNFFWDNTNKRLGIGGTPALTLDVSCNVGSNTAVAKFANTNAAGVVGFAAYDSGGVNRGTFGWANASVASPIAHAASKLMWYSVNSDDLVFCNQTLNAFLFGMTTNSIHAQWANGSSASVSATSTGRVRYNSTGQKFQISANAVAYKDIGLLAAALTTGSVPFSDSTGALAQDNANLFWDNTNKKLAVGTTTFLDNTGLAGATAPSLQVKGQGDISQIASISFGASAQASVAGIRGRGTQASPLAVQSGDTLMAFHGVGQYDTTINHISTASQVLFSASENWSVGARGGRIGWLTVINGGTNLFERFGVENDGGLTLQNSNSAAVSTASTGRLRYSTTNQRFQASVNTSAYSDLLTRDYVSVERKSADGVSDPTIDVCYVSGTGTDLTLASGPKDGFVKTFVITGGTGTVTPAVLANGDVLTWSSVPANVQVIWDATGATWHVLGTPRNVVVS